MFKIYLFFNITDSLDNPNFVRMDDVFIFTTEEIIKLHVSREKDEG